jgi:Ca2+-dependent lipid-binding protein
MPNKSESQVIGVVAPKSAVNQLMGLYIIVAFLLALSWFLGSMSCSFLWIFGIIFGLFIVWRTRLQEILERTLDWHKEHHNRKRALRQEETAEWLNFIINRWLVCIW